MTKKALRVFETGIWAALAFACAVTVSSCPTNAHAQALPWDVPKVTYTELLGQVVGACKPGGQCSVGTLKVTSTSAASPLCLPQGELLSLNGCDVNGTGLYSDGLSSVWVYGGGGSRYNFTSSAFVSAQDSTYDLGTAALEWEDAYIEAVTTSSTSSNPAALSVATNGYVSLNGTNASASSYINSSGSTNLYLGIGGTRAVYLTSSVMGSNTDHAISLGEASNTWLNAYLAIGTSTQDALANGYVASQVTTVGNVGTGEDTLYSQTISGNALTTTGRGLKIFANGNIANNANSKTLIFYWGATSCSTALNIPISINSAWRFTGYLYRTGSNTQRLVCTWEGTNGATGLWAWVLQSTNSATETESGSVDIRITGQSSAASDNDVEIYTALIENI